MNELVVRGTPRRFDGVLRPIARGLQLVVAGVATLVLAWMRAWTWLPVPLAASFLAYEAFFAWRGDRPVRLAFGPDGVTAHDRVAGRRSAVAFADVRACTALYRRASGDPGRVEVAIVLAGDEGPLLAMSLRVPSDDFAPEPEEVDVDAMDALLGGLAGLVRSLAPPDRVVRQIVRDPRPLDRLRRALPAEVRGRALVRLWRGAEPPLDDFGHLVGEPSATLLLDGARARLREASGEVSEAPLHLDRVGRTRREVTLLTVVDGRPARVAHELPLLVLELGGLGPVVVPAPAVDPALPERPLDEACLHVHGPEGAALIAHLQRHDLAAALPGPRPAAADPFAQARTGPNVIGSAAP